MIEAAAGGENGGAVALKSQTTAAATLVALMVSAPVTEIEPADPLAVESAAISA